MRGLIDADDPVTAIGELAGASAPWLFGVRHHSPACAVALPALLDAWKPSVLAIELPADLEAWMVWLGHPEARAPLAIAAVARSGDDLGFYPYADFSPELAAIRWARARDVPVRAINLPVACRVDRTRGDDDALGIADRLRGESDDSWEHLVEGPATAGDPERVRRAALLYGWALRLDAMRGGGGGVSARDLAREAHMRAVLAELCTGGARVAAVVGSFHAAALLPGAIAAAPAARDVAPDVEIVSSLIAYGFELLDARSGYPAGIRDPMWQQRLFDTQRTGGDVSTLVAACLVEITRGIRARGLPASVPDARAAADVARALASLRGLRSPGRRELVEAVQTALAQGEVMGRGRMVARAMEAVLVGRARGSLAPGTPRSGLGPHVTALLAELRLPHAQAAEPEELRLNPLRSRIDRRRHVALCRLRACGVPYGIEHASQGPGGIDSLTSVWRLQVTPASDALIELAGLRGVTLRQAALGSLRAERARHVAADTATPRVLLELATAAASAGAGELTRELVHELGVARLADATLPELLALLALLDRLAAGHVIGSPIDPADAVPGEIDVLPPPEVDRAVVIGAAVASVLGLAGSDAEDDARALGELVQILDRPEQAELGDGRLRWSIDELVRTGSPLIEGAAGVVQVMIGRATVEQLAAAIGGWVDAGGDAEGRRRLARRLRGALVVAGAWFEAEPTFLDELMDRVAHASDDAFLARAIGLREGFEVLSTASRRRVLEVVGERIGDGGGAVDAATEISPELLVIAAEADRAGRAAMAAVSLPGSSPSPSPSLSTSTAASVWASPGDISLRDRWRMILGHEREHMTPRAMRGARALDELYGRGHGEGSREPGGSGGGQDHSFPTVRAWHDEIDALFGEHVFEEVAGKAAAAGRVGALLELDPAAVAPSIELLEQLLSLKGALGEGALGKLRALVRRVVEELVRELAVRVRPALAGMLGQRATRRPTSALHLRRTVAANLAHARDTTDGIQLVPETLYFKQRTRRHLDWSVVLLVDVSGSMEPSVIYSAMMAAILSAVPWIAVKFVVFSTEVVDLSERAADPLALLLEIAVGGGTHIAKALRYARESSPCRRARS